MRGAIRRPLLAGVPACWTHLKFLPSSCLQGLCPGPLPRSWPGSVLIPLLNPPRRPVLSAGRPQNVRRSYLFSAKFSYYFWIGFLSTFGHFWRPKGSPKWHQNLTFSSLFPLPVLAPLLDAQRHEKVSFWRGPNHESVWPGQCLLNVRPFGRKTTFCRKSATFWEPK